MDECLPKNGFDKKGDLKVDINFFSNLNTFMSCDDKNKFFGLYAAEDRLQNVVNKFVEQKWKFEKMEYVWFKALAKYFESQQSVRKKNYRTEMAQLMEGLDKVKKYLDH